MTQCSIIITYILILTSLLIAVISVGGGLFLTLRYNLLNFNSTMFNSGKDEVHAMINDINRYPGVHVDNPPNVTNVDPLDETGVKSLVQVSGIIILVCGSILCAISFTALVAIFRQSKRLKTTSIVVIIIFLVVEVAIVFVLAFPEELIKMYFLKRMKESFIGLYGHDDESKAWNVVMKQFNCCGIVSYMDFNTSSAFDETWGEPIHSFQKPYPLSVPLVCCNAIYISNTPPKFLGPCFKTDYTNKKSCLSDLVEALNLYKIYAIVCIVVLCLIKIMLILVICYSKHIKPKSMKIQDKEEKWYSGKRQQPTRKPNNW